MGLKELLFKSDEEMAKNTPKKNGVNTNNVATTSSTSANANTIVSAFTQTADNNQPTTIPSATDGKVDENLLGDMLKILAERNIPGPDLLEVKQKALSLSGLGLSQEKMYEGAAKVLKQDNPDFTKEYLLKSVDTYIGFVNEMISDSMAQLEQKRTEMIGNKRTEISNMETKINDITLQIENLQRERENYKANINALSNDIKATEEDLNNKLSTFNVTANRLKSDLERDKSLLSNINF